MSDFVYPPQLRKAMLNRRAKPFQQFGQTYDYSTWNGATGCTHTVLQFLAWLWLGKWYTHDQVSKIAKYPSHNPDQRGMTPTEVRRFVTAVGLPYKVVFGMSAIDVAHASKRGPVGFGHMYRWWPDWKGYRVGGRISDGKPNGYATPSGKAGKTQLHGFEGAHFGCLLGYAASPTQPDLYYAWEPNHNSPSRPEKPPYDRMTYKQFKATYNSYSTALHRTLYALVPTKTLPAKGF